MTPLGLSTTTRARRIRSGTPAALLPVLGSVVLLALVLSGCSGGGAPAAAGSRSTSSPAPVVAPTSTATPAQAPSGTPASAATRTGTLGPRGYRGLTLGMSFAQVMATGKAVRGAQGTWFLRNHPNAELCLSRAGGLMAIFGDESMATPEGIGLGNTLAEIRAAYPNLKRAIDYFYVPLGSGTRYEFLVPADGTLGQWNLSEVGQTCFN